jgi:hypothetical protein
MAFYDAPGVFYDAGVLYDDIPPLVPLHKNRAMPKVKLELRNKSVDEKLTQANTIKTSLTGNAAFPTPNPTLTVYTAAITTLSTKHAAVKNLELQIKAAMADREAAETALDNNTTLLGAYVENASGGDPVKIQSAGMAVRNGKSATPALEQVKNLSASAGDDEGEIDLQWDPVKNARSYEIQISADPITTNSWRSLTPSSKSRQTIDGLQSGSKQWFRARAIGKGDPGPWSDPAVKTVP